ncbi:PREDICTED: uncharacterized protein LOC105126806 [Populus euphratica]|uniref:Uncharacterized protein LOC105126806 n=1 Tax=Populus euphratica TaxID=75702 RepID=A0AAJ6XPD3_POPEU|nr:PREDICTED: uncharacterized protein LOC105126806 [Populus euphratica]
MKGHQDAVTDVEPSLLSGDAPRQIYIAQLFYASLLQVHFLPKACDRSVALENTDFSLYLRAKCSMDYAQKVFLHAGQNQALPKASPGSEKLKRHTCELLRNGGRVGAEVLAWKFDEIDQETIEGDWNKFYQGFYGAFDDQFAAMDAVLNGKELYAHWAFENSLDKYPGVNFDVPPPI